MHPDLRDLEAFVAVCDTRGFGRAAERLGISQPAVSHRIAKLESDLGATLFEQPRRRIILTAEGAALLRASARLLEGLEALPMEIGGARWPSNEPLRIACAGAFGRYVVFPLLREPAFDDVRVRLFFRRPEQVYELVEEGACEIGFTYEPRVTRTMDLGEAFVEAFVLVAPRGHALDGGASLHDVASHDFITYEECDYVFGRWFGDVFGAQPSSLSSASHFERIEEVVARVSDGRGLSIVPEHSVRTEVAEGRIRVVERGWPPCLNIEYAVTRPGREIRPEVTALLARLAETSAAAVGGR